MYNLKDSLLSRAFVCWIICFFFVILVLNMILFQVYIMHGMYCGGGVCPREYDDFLFCFFFGNLKSISLRSLFNFYESIHRSHNTCIGVIFLFLFASFLVKCYFRLNRLTFELYNNSFCADELFKVEHCTFKVSSVGFLLLMLFAVVCWFEIIIRHVICIWQNRDRALHYKLENPIP